MCKKPSLENGAELGWPRGAVVYPALEILETKLDQDLRYLIEWLCFEQQFGLETSKCPFEPQLFCDSVLSSDSC